MSLSLIGAATSAGAYGPGQEQAPETLRRHGLLAALRESRSEVHDMGNVVEIRHRADPEHPAAANVELVRSAIERVADAVASAFGAGRDVLVLGGDCTVELGTVAGALADGSSVGLVYVDLDGDLNTPSTGDGVLDWMGLAHLLDVPGALPELAGAGPRQPMLSAEDVFLVGVDNLTTPESRLVDELGLRIARLDAVRSRLDDVIDDITAWSTRFDRVLVHVDIDVLHYPGFPLAHEVRDAPGLTIDELDGLTQRLRSLPAWSGLTLCEVDPLHASDESAQFTRLVELLAQAV